MRNDIRDNVEDGKKENLRFTDVFAVVWGVGVTNDAIRTHFIIILLIFFY